MIYFYRLYQQTLVEEKLNLNQGKEANGAIALVHSTVF